MAEDKGKIVDSDVARSLEDEGFEMDGEGGAMVVIRQRGETAADTQRKIERTLAEGRAPDLASYIRLNKRVVVPASDHVHIPPKCLEPGSWYFDQGNSVLYFTDAAGNLAEVRMNFQSIGTLKKYVPNKFWEDLTINLGQFGNELISLGFQPNPISERSFQDYWKGEMANYSASLKSQVEQSSPRFDF